jgi:hypothetical protein
VAVAEGPLAALLLVHVVDLQRAHGGRALVLAFGDTQQ